MHGTKDLCSGVQPGEKSERKRIVLEGQSAATVTFPVLPLKAEDFPIKVAALTPLGSDVIERQLHVVVSSLLILHALAIDFLSPKLSTIYNQEDYFF